MKQIYYSLITTLLLTSCQYKEETFVNPIFYEPMESLNDHWDVKITPTTFEMTNREYADSEIWHEDCEMWENTPTKVVLRCTHQLNKLQLEMWDAIEKTPPSLVEHSTREFIISPQEEQIYKGNILIVQYEYYEDITDRHFASRLGYVVDTSKDKVPTTK